VCGFFSFIVSYIEFLYTDLPASEDFGILVQKEAGLGQFSVQVFL
jgi:hypothetical protein